MNSTVLVNDAKVMSEGQITIPRNIRDALGVTTGDRVTFLVENGTITIMNSAVYALKKFQRQMAGEAEKAGLFSEEELSSCPYRNTLPRD